MDNVKLTTLAPLAFLLVITIALPASAVTIFERGKSEPTRARLISSSPQSVVIEERLPDGGVRQRTIPRAQIEDMIDPVSEERLASLSPDQPQAYRNYAEELAEKRVDPDAQAAAIRLYLIAAWLDPDDLARSCLLGLTALARSPEEERKFRAMAYLYDPDHDRRLLKRVSNGEPPKEPSDGREGLLRALALRRQGNRRAALLNASRDEVQKELQKHAGALTYEEFSQPGLSDELLTKIVALELSLETGDAAPSSSVSWSQIIASGDTRPAPSLTLETLTEFDPRQCVYRNGKWVSP